MKRTLRAVCSVVDPRIWLHMLRMLHFYGYSHVLPRRRVTMGAGVRMAPNTSIRNGERVSIGSGTRIGERCFLWAGDDHGRVDIGRHTLLGPGVFITASNYRMLPEIPATHQPKDEKDVRIGTDVWLGAGVTVVAGVTVGDGCVVGAGAVVTRSLPKGSIAVGAPARVVGQRGQMGRTPDEHPGTGRESGLAVSAIVAATAEGTADAGDGRREVEWPSTSQF